MSYWRCHYHFIWTTRERLPAIDADRESIIARCVASIADNDRFEIHAVGVVSDHVHVAASIPPRIAVASVVQKFKGSSSHQLTSTKGSPQPWPGWQAEYGVLTFGDGSVDRIVAYVLNQKEHHQNATLWAPLEQIRADRPGISQKSP